MIVTNQPECNPDNNDGSNQDNSADGFSMCDLLDVGDREVKVVKWIMKKYQSKPIQMNDLIADGILCETETIAAVESLVKRDYMTQVNQGDIITYCLRFSQKAKKERKPRKFLSKLDF